MDFSGFVPAVFIIEMISVSLVAVLMGLGTCTAFLVAVYNYHAWIRQRHYRRLHNQIARAHEHPEQRESDSDRDSDSNNNSQSEDEEEIEDELMQAFMQEISGNASQRRATKQLVRKALRASKQIAIHEIPTKLRTSVAKHTNSYEHRKHARNLAKASRSGIFDPITHDEIPIGSIAFRLDSVQALYRPKSLRSLYFGSRSESLGGRNPITMLPVQSVSPVFVSPHGLVDICK
jgi:hypothetical protein